MRGGNFATRAEIPENFETNRSYISSKITSSSTVSKWYKVWILNRHVVNSRIGIPSFSAANSMLAINSKPITRLAFTPIIPHPVTEYDAIFTAMVNFQDVDVLQQRGMSCGLFCSDEETYRLAKEFQLTVCSCHVTYAFESESTLYSCLNVKELLARSRREI